MRIAGIDIGTNTILMTVADKTSDGTINIIRDEHAIARLGEGVDASGIIIPQAILRAEDILRKYKQICTELDVREIRVVATSAMRDANNSSDVINKFEKLLDSRVATIDGKTEAHLSYIGSVPHGSDSNVIDIGGGSTEFIQGRNNAIIHSNSIQVGAVRLTERFYRHSPPIPDEFKNSDEYLSNLLKTIVNNDFTGNTYLVGGTATTIASIHYGLAEFSYEMIHGKILSLDNINAVLGMLKSLSASEINKKFGVPPQRADVITAGTLIAKRSLEASGSDQAIISVYGIRYGLIAFNDYNKLLLDRN